MGKRLRLANIRSTKIYTISHFCKEVVQSLKTLELPLFSLEPGPSSYIAEPPNLTG